MVPSAESESYASDSRFHQSAGHQKLFHQLWSAVIAISRVTFAITIAHLGIFLLDIQCIEQLVGSEHSERLLVKCIQPAHQSTLIHIAPKLIELAQEQFPVAQTIQCDTVENHVRSSCAVGLEWSVGWAKKSRLPGVRPRHVAHFGGKTNEGRDGFIDWSLDLRQDRTHAWPSSGGRIHMAAAGQTLDGVMVTRGTHDRANDGALIHESRHQGQMLANLDSGNIRGNGLELSTQFRRRVR